MPSLPANDSFIGMLMAAQFGEDQAHQMLVDSNEAYRPNTADATDAKQLNKINAGRVITEGGTIDDGSDQNRKLRLNRCTSTEFRLNYSGMEVDMHPSTSATEVAVGSRHQVVTLSSPKVVSNGGQSFASIVQPSNEPSNWAPGTGPPNLFKFDVAPTVIELDNDSECMEIPTLESPPPIVQTLPQSTCPAIKPLLKPTQLATFTPVSKGLGQPTSTPLEVIKVLRPPKTKPNLAAPTKVKPLVCPPPSPCAPSLPQSTALPIIPLPNLNLPATCTSVSKVLGQLTSKPLEVFKVPGPIRKKPNLVATTKPKPPVCPMPPPCAQSLPQSTGVPIKALPNTYQPATSTPVIKVQGQPTSKPFEVFKVPGPIKKPNLAKTAKPKPPVCAKPPPCVQTLPQSKAISLKSLLKPTKPATCTPASKELGQPTSTPHEVIKLPGPIKKKVNFAAPTKVKPPVCPPPPPCSKSLPKSTGLPIKTLPASKPIQTIEAPGLTKKKPIQVIKVPGSTKKNPNLAVRTKLRPPLGPLQKTLPQPKCLPGKTLPKAKQPATCAPGNKPIQLIEVPGMIKKKPNLATRLKPKPPVCPPSKTPKPGRNLMLKGHANERKPPTASDKRDKISPIVLSSGEHSKLPASAMEEDESVATVAPKCLICPNPAVENERWNFDYCSESCVVVHACAVHVEWVKLLKEKKRNVQ